jgi:hypothetical protein
MASTGKTGPISHGWLRRRSWVIAIGILIALACLTLVVILPWFGNRIPAELQGRWEVVDGEYKGGMVEFLSNGTMTSNVDPASPASAIPGSVTVDGRLLRMTRRDPSSNRETTDSRIIIELSDQQLVTQSTDPRNPQMITMRRLTTSRR